MQMYKVLEKPDGTGYIVFDSQSMRVFQFKGSPDQLASAFHCIMCKEVSPQASLHKKRRRCETLTIMLTNACNLNCKYCYFHFHPSQEFNQISSDKIISAYGKVLEYFPDGIECIQFFGGEPLLCFRIIQEVTKQIVAHSEKSGVSCPRFGISTNGLLITEEVLDFFYRYKFFVRISIDGSEENNSSRVDYKNKPIYSKLVETIGKIREMYPDFSLHAEMTYSAHHIKNYLSTCVHDVEILRTLGFSSVHMVPMITSDFHDPNNVFSENCSQKDLKTYVGRAYDLMFESLQTESHFYITDYIDIANRINSKRKRDTFCNAGILQFALGPDGVLYPCHMYYGEAESPSKPNLYNYYKNPLQNFHAAFQEKEQFCKDCWNAPLCGKCIFAGIVSERFCDFRRFQSEYILARMWPTQREDMGERN